MRYTFNTSFNLSWEPIVNTPEEAYRTFMQSEMDVLVLEDFVLHKKEQPLGLELWGPARCEAHPANPWADPLTGEPLMVTRTVAINPATGTRYSVEEGIPRLFVPTARITKGEDTTEIVTRSERHQDKSG